MFPFLIPAGLAAVGGIFKGISSIFGGIHANEAAKDNAIQARAEAGVAGDQALRAGDATAAQAATQAAANGGGFTGSTMGVISSLSQQAMFNARAAAYRGNAQARADLYSGRQAMAQGIQGGISGAIGAGSSLMGGFAQQAAEGRQLRAIQSIGAGGYSGADYVGG